MLARRLTSLSISVQRSLVLRSVDQLGTIMKSFNDQKQHAKALELFNDYSSRTEMKTASGLAIGQAIKACTYLKDFDSGTNIHRLTESQWNTNHYIRASLIHFYMNFAQIAEAQRLFDQSPKKTLAMTTAMMTGFLSNGQPQKAIDLLPPVPQANEVTLIVFFNACAQVGNEQALRLVKKSLSTMPKSFENNQRLLNSLFNALLKCGDCSGARAIFAKMDKTVSGYGYLMSQSLKQDHPEQVLHLYREMKVDRIEPNHGIYFILIKALAQVGTENLSQSIIKEIPKSILSDQFISTALIDMWGKNGNVPNAEVIFQTLPQPDRISFTAMINSYGLNGMGNEAVELFHRVPRGLADESLYVCTLNACSHSALIEQARTIFSIIPQKTATIVTTMVDCLARASIFDEAQQLIDHFERENQPTWSMYMAMLSAARNDRNETLSEKIYQRMKELFSDLIHPLTSATVLLANTYGSAGKTDKASQTRNRLNGSGLKKKVGLSWTSPNGILTLFRVHDRSHPLTAEIYVEVGKMSEQLLSHDHEYDSSWITRPMQPDETVESILCGHSEKLAIAYNFVVDPEAKRIHIAKNLRVCGDCHRATKLLAAIRQCEIIVRDANRIHHFHVSGQCSCQDYF